MAGREGRVDHSYGILHINTTLLVAMYKRSNAKFLFMERRKNLFGRKVL